MNRSRILPLLSLAAALALVACHPRPKTGTPPTDDPTAPQAVEVTSRLKATVVGVGPAELTLVGVAIHTPPFGRVVIFRAKQLLAVDARLGPVTATLNPQHESRGTLDSDTFPKLHRQDFFLRIESQSLGVLVSDAPITLSATIRSSPPAETYQSSGGDVAFYKEGDPDKKPVLTVHSVSSDVKPARSQAVDITSRIKARVADRQVDLVVSGRAAHVLGGRSVIFTSKLLRAVNPIEEIGPLTVTLAPRGQSVGTLASEKPPTEHRQSFYLQLDSGRLGTLVSDAPVIVEAHIQSFAPTATYKMAGSPVAFYKQGDPGKAPVLTIEGVESDVTPAAQQKGYGQ